MTFTIRLNSNCVLGSTGFNARFGEGTTVLLFAGPAWEKPHDHRPGGARHGLYRIDHARLRHGPARSDRIDPAAAHAQQQRYPTNPLFFGDVTRQQTVRAASLCYVYPPDRVWSLYTQISTGRVSHSVAPFSCNVRSGSTGLTWKY